MEVLNTSNFPPTPSSLNNLTKKTRLTLRKTHLKHPKTSPISSHFRRPDKRRKSLRKKLTQQQVIPKDSKFVDNLDDQAQLDSKVASFDNDNDNDNDNGSSFDSGMWDKLEGWVDLYKKDSEFWGIGFNPIFIVFQDGSNGGGGKVDKVMVDEDEILRRNGVDPLYFKEASDIDMEEFSEVRGKINHARVLARGMEMEGGSDVIPRNSSVARFVVSGEGDRFGLVSRITSVSVPKNVVGKVCRVGVGVACGVLLVWMVKKVVGLVGKGGELTRFEKEMLTRKMKARVEKEKEMMVKGSVEVVEKVSDVIVKRPRFDKESVLDGIRKAKGSGSDRALDVAGADSSEKDFRIKEIQMMARRAREIERGERAETEGNDVSSNEKSSSMKTSVRRMPKIIRSVKEAREYLSSKIEDDKALDCSDVDGILGSNPALNAEYQAVEEMENDISRLNEESQNLDISDQIPSYDTGNSSNGGNQGGESSLVEETWLEKNFHEMDPIVNKMRGGFRDSYMVAREKVKEEVGTTLDFKDLDCLKDDTELDWMKDDKLREIVFKVRDNELAGRDPFHSMDVDDKVAFFEGLESKVEKENQKLATLHQWLHSNIENIDYGVDGISIYDPPEKFIPKWKGPPIDEFPEFLSKSRDQQQEASSLQKGNQSTEYNHTTTSQEASITKPRPEKKVARAPKTVIEASDGSIKPGKKSGKEYWQHTKKWSRGFVESYNAESDPEMKSTMKDIGKDLDRWITEKEVQEAADLMDKIPQKGRAFVEKKINKLKREMEMFGPQAVVSKYREYSNDKEEDYLWWLDLPHVLCIELYTYEGEDQEIGFYTLEMAEDLEIEPKPQHVIAFQDAADSKNFCYIIQAHLEMLGKGNAFIVPQHPKDVFRQAKENGFGVTVIRKGEVQLNVDQPLEEVEELISEIGSKMYHDKIVKERSVDMSSLMEGVFGFNKAINRRRKKIAHQRKP